MPSQEHPSTQGSARGGETILLVEDDPVVRALIYETLTQAGYKVLEAGYGAEALALGERHEGPIHLLVADVVMPQMSGPELAGRLTALRPSLKVLYISGYAEDAIVHHSAPDQTVYFLSKPFTPDELTRKAREVLDSPP